MYGVIVGDVAQMYNLIYTEIIIQNVLFVSGYFFSYEGKPLQQRHNRSSTNVDTPDILSASALHPSKCCSSRIETQYFGAHAILLYFHVTTQNQKHPMHCIYKVKKSKAVTHKKIMLTLLKTVLLAARPAPRLRGVLWASC